MIKLSMICHRVLPHGMDGCFPQNYFMFLPILFLCSMIFQTLNFKDLSLSDFLPEFGIVFSLSLLLQMRYFAVFVNEIL